MYIGVNRKKEILTDLENSVIRKAIETSQAYIENITGQNFESREFTAFAWVKGEVLKLSIPLINLFSIRTISGESIEIDKEYPMLNDQPELRLLSKLPKGTKIIIKGEWGYLENGETPLLIKEICEKLTLLALDKYKLPIGVYEQWTDGNKIKISEKMIDRSMTGIPEIDQVLRKYKRRKVFSV